MLFWNESIITPILKTNNRNNCNSLHGKGKLYLCETIVLQASWTFKTVLVIIFNLRPRITEPAVYFDGKTSSTIKKSQAQPGNIFGFARNIPYIQVNVEQCDHYCEKKYNTSKNHTEDIKHSFIVRVSSLKDLDFIHAHSAKRHDLTSPPCYR